MFYQLLSRQKIMADCTRSKVTSPKKGRLSIRGKKRKRSSLGLKGKPKETRVDIGVAFDRWRSMKAAKGWRTDAEVALSLMDITKTLPTKPASSGASDEKIKFSQSEMQTLVDQEVHDTVQKKKTRLHDLIQVIQQLDRAVDYETSMKKLEVRINRISERAEAAIDFMAKAQEKRPGRASVIVEITRPKSDEAMETSAQHESAAAGKISTDCEDDNGKVFIVMEHMKEVLKKMQSESEALTGATADLSGELHPSGFTPYGSLNIKPKDEQKIENHVTEPVQQCEELKANPVKVERLPLSESADPEYADFQQVNAPYPPLPTNTFPSILHIGAALYNIPSRPQVRLALIKNPAGLSVLWNSLEDDPCRPPMAKYSVYMTVEKVKGSNVFPDWTCKEVDAKALPMCMMISKYKPGRKVCVAVVGKDKFGRYGPYSSVATASLPE